MKIFALEETVRTYRAFHKKSHGNVLIVFWGRIFLCGNIVFGGFVHLFMHMVFAVFAMHNANVLVAKITMRQNIGKPNAYRLCNAASVK